MFILTVTHSFNVQHTKHKGLCSSIRMTLKLVGFEFSDRIPLIFFLCSKNKKKGSWCRGLVNFKNKVVNKNQIMTPPFAHLKNRGKGLICTGQWGSQYLAQSYWIIKTAFVCKVIDPVLGPRIVLRVQQRLTVGSC